MAELTPEEIRLEQERLELLQKQNEAVRDLTAAYNTLGKLKGKLSEPDKEAINLAKILTNISGEVEKSINRRLSGSATAKDLAKQLNQLTLDKSLLDKKSSDIEDKINTDRATAFTKAVKAATEERNLRNDLRTAEGRLNSLIAARNAAEVAGNANAVNHLTKLIKSNEYNIKLKEQAIDKVVKEKEVQKELVKALDKEKEAHEQIKKQLDEEISKTKEAKKLMELKEPLNVLKENIKNTFKPFTELFTLVGIFKSLIDAALRFNKISVEIGKNIGYGKDQANRVATSIKNIAQDSNNVNVTLKNAAEAMTQLNEATGLVTEYSADALKTQIMLTKQFGLTGEEAAGIYKYSILTGKASSQINKEMVGAFVATRNQLRVGVPFKATIAEAAKISGQLAANLQNNPAIITAAVVQAKALGTTLEQTQKQGESLLNWESSIENELKAELITGQQLNLERARAAALVGDQVTVAQELANQGMTLNKFQNMNVIAQKSFAEALGLSADELANQLKMQQMAIEQGKSLAQITEEEALQAEKRQGIQDKFNAAVEKLQDFFGNLLAGPLGQFLEFLTKSLDYITAIGVGLLTWQVTSKAVAFYEGITAMQKQKQISFGAALLAQSRTALGISTAKATADTVSGTALSFGTLLPIILGAGATIYSLLSSFSKGDDVASMGGYGKRMLLEKGSITALNDNDNLYATTNTLQSSRRGGGGSSNTDAHMAAIVERMDNHYNKLNEMASKPSIALIDGKDPFAKNMGSIPTLGMTQASNTHPFA
jgi:hypothetical protein